MPKNIVTCPRWIVFEGIDGCGKTSLVEEVRKKLAGTPYSGEQDRVKSTREPSGSGLGESLKHPLTEGSLPSTTQALFFLGLMSYHINTKVGGWLDDGRVVLGDRHYPSTLVYQGLTIKNQWLWPIIQETTSYNGALPLVYILDVPPEVAFAREYGDGSTDTHWAQGEIERLSILRNRYCEMANQYGWIIVDADQNPKKLRSWFVTEIKRVVGAIPSPLVEPSEPTDTDMWKSFNVGTPVEYDLWDGEEAECLE